MSRTNRYSVEPLEPRKYLTITFSGTSGDDTIIVATTGNDVIGHTLHITLNGNTSDFDDDGSDVEIDAGDGNDTIHVRSTDDQNVSIFGGHGDDTCTVGQGNLTDDINGEVTFGNHALENGGNDKLIMDDTTGVDVQGTGRTYDITDETLTVEETIGTAKVRWDPGIESKVLNATTASDLFYIDALEAGMSINGGNGDDIFDLGANTHVVQKDFVAPLIAPTTVPTAATLNGGNGGQDFLLIDDSSSLSNRTSIDVNNDTVLDNVSAINMVRMRINTHPMIPYEPVVFTGLEAPTNFVTVSGNAGDDFVSMGTADSPINVSSYGVTGTFNLKTGNNFVEIHDRKRVPADPPDNWGFSYPVVSAIGSVFPSRRLSSMGSTIWNLFCDDDHNEIDMASADGPVGTQWHVHIHGGGGNDFVQPVDQVQDGLDPALPAYNQHAFMDFTYGPDFSFDGGTGQDQLQLEPEVSPDANGADEQYFIGPNQLLRAPAGQPLTPVIAGYSNVEDLQFIGDGDPNVIRFGDLGTGGIEYLRIDGGFGGRDTFTNLPVNGGPRVLANDLAGIMEIVGNFANNSTLTLNDSADAGATYTMDMLGPFPQLTVTSALHPQPASVHWSQMQLVQLAQSAGNDTTTISKLDPAQPVSIYGGSGNDSFTVGGGDLDNNGFNHLQIDGGPGTDSIEFDDHADLFNSSESETYQLNTGELDKGVVTVDYANLESLQLDASTSGSALPNFGEQVNLNTTSGIPTTIVGCFNRACFINVGSSSLDAIDAPVTLTMGGAGGATINDQGSTVSKTYLLGFGLLTASTGQSIDFSGSGIVLNTGSGNNSVIVGGLDPNAPSVINSGSGNDTFTVGDLSDFQSPLAIHGGGGSDAVTFDQTGDQTGGTSTFDSASFTRSGQTVNVDGFESAQIWAGSGDDTIQLPHVSIPLRVEGDAGNDIVNIGSSNLDANLLSSLTVNGDAGTDTVVLDDRADVGDDSYALTSNTARKIVSGVNKPVMTLSAETRTLQANRGSNPIDVQGGAWTVFGNAGNESITTAAGSSTTLDTGGEVTTGGLVGDSLSIAGGSGLFPGALVTMLTADQIGSLTVNTGGRLLINSPTALLTLTHDLILTGVIDLSSGGMIVRNGLVGFSVANAMVRSGYNNGAWNGTSTQIGAGTIGGINSSAARTAPLIHGVGVASASSLFGAFPASFMGQSVNAGDLLLRYTLYGDANLDTSVDVSDLGIVATNWQGTNKTFAQGDFNFDSKVDVTDLGLLATTWQQSLLPELPSTRDRATPRPVSPIDVLAAAE